MLIMLICADIK